VIKKLSKQKIYQETYFLEDNSKSDRVALGAVFALIAEKLATFGGFTKPGMIGLTDALDLIANSGSK
jgi:hypothetical protein